MSKGEERIAQILSASKIKYEREKTFGDLKKGQLRFDFYIPSKNAIIEYNGEQHYRYVSVFFKSQHEFELAQGRDCRKISWCLGQNINLYIIPYWEIENLFDAADLFQDKFLARSKWKNYNDYDAYQKHKV